MKFYFKQKKGGREMNCEYRMKFYLKKKGREMNCEDRIEFLKGGV